MVKIMRLHEYISEQEITDSINAGNTKKNVATEISLLQGQESQKQGLNFLK